MDKWGGGVYSIHMEMNTTTEKIKNQLNIRRNGNVEYRGKVIGTWVRIDAGCGYRSPSLGDAKNPRTGSIWRADLIDGRVIKEANRPDMVDDIIGGILCNIRLQAARRNK